MIIISVGGIFNTTCSVDCDIEYLVINFYAVHSFELQMFVNKLKLIASVVFWTLS